ncbi:LysR substrate-binding domain-containing protein [Brevundimonas staleyi]|uniref:LysR substrate-binding domain-containing protein n=1 Tax=Brevundimonas staleyi TaxID=74326 RepID=UPI00366F6F0E
MPLLKDFAARYPHILVDLSLTDTVVDVAAGQANVAIRFGLLADSALTARKIGETGRVVVASPDYLARRGEPMTPEDLYDHDCLNFSFRRMEPVWPFRRDGVDFALTVKGPVEANNGETLTQLARDGVGITRVGAFSAEDDIRDGRLVPCWRRSIPVTVSRSTRSSSTSWRNGWDREVRRADPEVRASFLPLCSAQYVRRQ